MKRMILHWASVLLASVAVLSTSCNEDNEDKKVVTPEFPKPQSLTIPAGETTCPVTFTPNMDWTISIPTDPETSKWFELRDGEVSVTSIQGKASKDPVTVTIATTDQVEFDATPSCEVSLTMGGQTQVIATITRGTTERQFDIYQVEFDEYGQLFNPGIYNETPEAKNNQDSPIEMFWTYNGALEYAFKATSNFSWLINIPEEAEGWFIKAREVDVDGDNNSKEVRFDIKFTTEEILDGTTLGIDFYDASVGKDEDPGNNTHNMYYFKVPAARDLVYHYDIPEDKTLNFLANGKYSAQMAGMGVERDSFDGSVSSTKGLTFHAVDDTYMIISGLNSWIKFEDKWDDESDELFQKRDYSITVSENDGDARTAILLAIPQSKLPEGDPSDIIADGFTDIKEEYKQYIFATVEQAGNSDEGGEGGDSEAFISYLPEIADRFADESALSLVKIETEEQFMEIYEACGGKDFLIEAFEGLMSESPKPVYALTCNTTDIYHDGDMDNGIWHLSLSESFEYDEIERIPETNAWLTFDFMSEGGSNKAFVTMGLSEASENDNVAIVKFKKRIQEIESGYLYTPYAYLICIRNFDLTPAN